MPTPLGHALAAVAAARVLRLRNPDELAAFAAAAVLPDVDLGVSLLLRGDPMALHRRIGTHSPLFPLGVGAGGWFAARDGRRVRAALVAAAGAGLHLLTDRFTLPYPESDGTKDVGWLRFTLTVTLSTLIDLAVFGPLAALAVALTKEAVDEA